jgi:hypothetical protein
MGCSPYGDVLSEVRVLGECHWDKNGMNTKHNSKGYGSIMKAMFSTKHGVKRIHVGLVFAAAAFVPFHVAMAIPIINYGTAYSFSVLAGSEISSTGPSTIGQNVGLSPTAGTGITGLLPGQVGGTIYAVDVSGPAHDAGNNPGLVNGAKSDFSAAYTVAAGQTPFTSLGAQLAGQTLVPGVYRLPDTALLGGTLTLNANGVADPFWIFQATSDLVTASGSSVVFLDGFGTPCDVLWQVPSQATLGSDSIFVGTIMAGTSIVMNNGATLYGRAWAKAAVTLDNNNITGLPCMSIGGTADTGGSGGNTVPDTGSTFALLSCGLAALSACRGRFFSLA